MLPMMLTVWIGKNAFTDLYLPHPGNKVTGKKTKQNKPDFTSHFEQIFENVCITVITFITVMIAEVIRCSQCKTVNTD